MKLSKLSFAILASLTNTAVLADTTNLTPVIVTANNTTQPFATVTSNLTVINATTIEEKQLKTLAEAVKQIPGLSTYANGGAGTTTSIFLRGMSGKNILVLQNGIQLNDPTLTDGTTNFANILLDNVERIEIIKGPQSGVWGANASAGVINIITKKGGRSSTVNLEFGANNHKRIAATLGASNEQADFTLSFNDTKTDGFTAIKEYKTSGEGNENDGFNQQDVSLNIGLNTLKNQRLEVFLKESSGNSEGDFSSPNSASASTFANSLKQLQYVADMNNVNTKFYVQQSHITRSYPAYSAVYEGKVNQFGGQADWQYGTSQNATLAFSKRQLEDIQKTRHYDNSAVSANNTNLLFHKLVLTEALRYDEYSDFDNKVTGKLGLKYDIAPQVFISANGGTGYNAPSLYQLSNLQTGLNLLKPESIQGYDATLSAYGFELTYFSNQVEDEITTNSSYKYYNQSGTSHYQGIEAFYKRPLSSIQAELSINYTQQTAKDKQGAWLARRPEQQAGINFDYYGLAKTHVGFQTQYIGNLYDKANQQGANIGNYSVTDLVADYRFNKTFTLYAKAQNIFNEDYTPAVASYQSNNTTPKTVYNNGGTLWYAGIRGKF